MGNQNASSQKGKPLPVLLFGAVFLFFSGALRAQDLTWANRAGGNADDSASDIAIDASGNSYVTGRFEGVATFGAGEGNETILISAGVGDLFVAKYEADSPTNAHKPSTLPDNFRLAQNYPNPFNPQTTIRYGLPHTASIRLVIYDMMGRRVRVLVEGLQAPGWHEIVFETSDLPSGAYFYRLEAGSFQETGQMLLVK